MSNEARNVRLSITDEIDTQLGSITLHWPGTKFDSDGVAEWITAELPDFTPQATRLSERHEFRTVSFNCYARTGPGGKSIHRVYELADLVLGAFDQVTLEVLDWDSEEDPKPTLFYLRFAEGAITPIQPPPEAGSYLMQMNVTFEAALIG